MSPEATGEEEEEDEVAAVSQSEERERGKGGGRKRKRRRSGVGVAGGVVSTEYLLKDPTIKVYTKELLTEFSLFLGKLLFYKFTHKIIKILRTLNNF